MSLRILLATSVASILASAIPAAAAPLCVVGFNVESGGADPAVVGEVATEVDGCDLWGFSEVQNDADAGVLEQAVERDEAADFERILGTTGGADRLLIVYNADRFEPLGDSELDHINIQNRVRAPLVAHLRDRESGAELLFMVNHLYRSNAAARHEQAELLNAWGREQDLPVVAVGDYNFDWGVTNGDADHDAGFDGMTADGVFAWVRPAELVRTQCSAHDSVLDFVFVAGPAREWPAESTILRPEPSYCPGDSTTSDHRPVMAAFELPPVGEAEPPSLDELMARIEQVEETVRDVQARLDRLGR